MKRILYTLIAVAIFISCNKDDKQQPINLTETISAEDLTATAGMDTELGMMSKSLDSLMAAHTPAHQHHWDSLYHMHDSIYWHHHSLYHHEAYSHDDHHHSWVPYDSTIHHEHHFHHVYPDHPHDSLIIVHNSHAHDNSDHHHQGHTIDQHHTLDSLHTVHGVHHP